MPFEFKYDKEMVVISDAEAEEIKEAINEESKFLWIGTYFIIPTKSFKSLAKIGSKFSESSDPINAEDLPPLPKHEQDGKNKHNGQFEIPPNLDR